MTQSAIGAVDGSAGGPAGIDLNLLVALDVLLEEQSVQGAARRLHLSEPAMSRTLGRIRKALGGVGCPFRPCHRRLASDLLSSATFARDEC
ncbi:LysR family transcriptional regulator, partial [Streptomyces sp. NPDC052127]|uniref:helix-turn-helix domain-containing protein n=1 Tax=Streptomyces sp. NPDC052127 TaxID=3155679 RepID=UPI00341E2951